jgi:hypothetical protein
MKAQYLLIFLSFFNTAKYSLASTREPIRSRHEWGFWAHKFINRAAVYRLPPEMGVFFKKNIEQISENAVNPDKRRYAVLGEAERHYIDLDAYGEEYHRLPRNWTDAVKRLGEDSLRKHGIAPWYIQGHLHRLTEAFSMRNHAQIIRLATDLGHYVADIHVPLHTTRNYNGQLTGQEGIHAFWESRLPELYAREYDLWTGPARYLEDTNDIIWETIFNTHAACDSVLEFEAKTVQLFPESKRYTYEVRNNVLVKVQSGNLSEAYHNMLSGQVERQLKGSVRLIADLWYTCWVNAGQPVLNTTTPIEVPALLPVQATDSLPGIRYEEY